MRGRTQRVQTPPRSRLQDFGSQRGSRKELQAEINRYVDAIGAGLLSATIKTRLEAADSTPATLANSAVTDVREVLARVIQQVPQFPPVSIRDGVCYFSLSESWRTLIWPSLQEADR
jgi:hypothetical protein